MKPLYHLKQTWLEYSIEDFLPNVIFVDRKSKMNSMTWQSFSMGPYVIFFPPETIFWMNKTVHE
jgi:hypothetical protein